MDLTETAQLPGNFGEFFGAIVVVMSLSRVRSVAVQRRNRPRTQGKWATACCDMKQTLVTKGNLFLLRCI